MFDLRGLLLAFLLVGANGASSDKPKLKARQMPKPPPRETLVTAGQIQQKTLKKLEEHKRLNIREKKEIARAELATYKEMRRAGVDEVSNTPDAVKLRNYRLRNKKRRGIIRKEDATLAAVLFPDTSPEEYSDYEQVWIYADLVESKKTQVPFDYYDLPGCKKAMELDSRKKMRATRNLGYLLQGNDLQPAPFDFFVKQDKPCTTLCTVKMNTKELRWMRKLIERQYRVHLSLDSLPVLMRSDVHNYAVRGYPVGFRLPGVSGQSRDLTDFYVYNHLKFTITYHENRHQFDGIRITGFDVHPVSITHDSPSGALDSFNPASCQGFHLENDPGKYLMLEFESSEITYSYDVRWIKSDLEWTDRWDVYVFGAPDDDIHYFPIVCSLTIVLFMTGAIATIMIRILRKDVAGYNELQTIEEGPREIVWQQVHGDVFRPPSFSPMLLSALVGTGVQIGTSLVIVLLLSIFNITNWMKKGEVLTSLILVYILNGAVGGYVSARIYKFSEAKNWKMNSFLTATALPGVFFLMFSSLNVFLSFEGAATAVSFLSIVGLFLLGACVSGSLVVIGSFLGLKAPVIEVPTKTNQIARIIPDNPRHMNPMLIMLMGGILPYGSVCVELAFIMPTLWLHRFYFAWVFLLPVLGILAATCAQVSIFLCYLQLCAEDHRWWWKSFWNCATAGLYVFAHSLWYLSSRLDLVGALPVMVYLTYMSMISICFGVFCGAISFLSSLWFTRAIYSAVTADFFYDT